MHEETKKFALLYTCRQYGCIFHHLENLASKMPHFRLSQTLHDSDNAVLDILRSFKVNDFSTNQKAMPFSTSHEENRDFVLFSTPR